MSLAYQIKKWDNTYPVLFTVLRVILGACLVIKGIYFLNHQSLLQDVIEDSRLKALNLTALLSLFITWVHILGGTFIILGLFTPIAIWLQLPIVLGAIIFVNTRTGIFATHSDLLFSIFIFTLLLLFAFEGSGKFSMDKYLKRYLL